MARRPGARLSKAMLIAGVVEGVGIVATLIFSLVTRAPAAWQVALVPVAAVLIASLKAGVDTAARDPEPEPAPAPGPAGHPHGTYGQHGTPGPYGQYGTPGGGYGRAPVPSPPSDRRGRVGTLVTVLLVLLLVCGGGGLAVTAGVGYAYGWISGNEAQTAVYSGSATGGGSGLRIAVTHVWVTAHFTKVEVVAANTTGDSLSLPVFGNCVLSGADGRTLEADPMRTQLAKDGWSDSVPSGVPHRGVIVFGGRLAPGDASLTFATVFGSLNVPRSVTVRGIPISAPAG
ncbi:MAG: hypothetical protein ACRDT6_04520 [Micromonosporaceae bacterium]